MLKNFLSIILLFLCFNVVAQPIPSEQLIEKGKQLYDDGQYDEAIQQYQLVHENDSNYCAMLAELALTYLAKENYDSAIYVADLGLALKGSNQMHLTRTKGTAYDALGKTDKAIAIYQEAIQNFPYNYLLHFNLGITYYNAGMYPEAMACFQQSATNNPYHASSHRMLGLLAARQKMYTRAMLSLETFLALEPRSNRSNPMLVYLENFSGNYLDTSWGDFIDPFIDNSLFDEVDHYFKSKVVLNERYPSLIDFRADLIKQTQMVLEVLPLEQLENDFWVQMYFPFFHEVKKGNYIEPLFYTLLTSTGSDPVEKYLSKNEKTLNEFYQTGSKLSYIRQKQIVKLDGEAREYACRYFDSGQLYSIGDFNEQEQETGPWEYYFENGCLQARGHFNQGEKEGQWEYYNASGQLTSTEVYSAGELDGTYIAYYDNGNKRVVVPYIKGSVEDTVCWYDYFGMISDKVSFNNTLREGQAITYHLSGIPREIYNYKAGELTGEYLSFFSTGDTSFVHHYAGDQLNGSARDYYMNGQLYYTGNYKEGLQDGPWVEYYSNGRLKAKATYKKGEMVGEQSNYYQTGQLESTHHYNDVGKADGAAHYFDREGHFYLEEVYKNGILVKISSIDKAGNPYSVSENAEGTLQFATFDCEGRKLAEGAYMQGKQSGTWNSYYRNGQLATTMEYVNGTPVGQLKTYYKNGQISAVSNYIDGQFQGEYIGYEKNGKIKAQGYYQKGKTDNLWQYFNSKGELESESYYVNGNLTGYNYDYGVNGELKDKRKNQNGRIVNFIEFNQQGDTTHFYDLLKSPNYVLKGAGDLDNCQISTLAGMHHGELTWYHPNGQVLSHKSMELGLSEGPYERFHENGQLAARGNLLNGDRVGEWHFYDESGNLEKHYFYFEDEKDSINYIYHPNGKLADKSSYFNGELHGDCIQYDEHGELMVKLIYNHDELIGYQYNKNGALCDTIPVKGGAFKVEAFFDNGNKSYEMNLLNYFNQGELKKYDSTGQLRELRTYQNDLKHGLSEDYYANGNVQQSVNYVEGLKEGLEVQYFANGKKKKELIWKSDVEHGTARYYNQSGQQTQEVKYENGLFVAVKN